MDIFVLLKCMRRKYYANYNLITNQSLWSIFSFKNRIEIKFNLNFEKGFMEEMSIEDDRLAKTTIKKLRNGCDLETEDICEALFAVCKECKNRTNYAYLDATYKDKSESELSVFHCEKCEIYYFVCGQCLREKIQGHNFQKESIFEVDLMELVEHHNYDFIFLETFFSVIFRGEELQVIYKNEKAEVIFENKRLYCRIGEEKIFLSEGRYDILESIADYIQNFTFKHEKLKITGEEFGQWITLENSDIFYHKHEYGEITGPDGGFGTEWKCKKHGTYEYCDK